MHPIATDKVEYPRLSERGQRYLQTLFEDSLAPPFNYHCGDRLDEEGAEQVTEFAQRVRQGRSPAADAMAGFIERTIDQCPFYRSTLAGFEGSPLSELPSCTRDDLNRRLTDFVPDDVDLGEMIVHSTSGRTARPLLVPHHPAACASYLPLFDAMLNTVGKELAGGAEQLAIAMICGQRSTITCATIATWLGEAGFVKVNLGDSWLSSRGAAAYLDRLRPEILTGDPIAFSGLARSSVKHQPKALLSTAMSLSPGLRKALEERFGCEVIDYYSTMESGPVAVRLGEVYAPIAPDLLIELLDDDGEQVAPGERGELTLTGGRNPFLPLIRYRTGDFARYMPLPDGQLRFDELDGRPSVVFKSGDRLVNNIDVTRALQDLPLSRFQLHQDGTDELVFRATGDELRSQEQAVRKALGELFEPRQVKFERLDDCAEKLVTYQSSVGLSLE